MGWSVKFSLSLRTALLLIYVSVNLHRNKLDPDTVIIESVNRVWRELS